MKAVLALVAMDGDGEPIGHLEVDQDTFDACTHDRDAAWRLVVSLHLVQALLDEPDDDTSGSNGARH